MQYGIFEGMVKEVSRSLFLVRYSSAPDPETLELWISLQLSSHSVHQSRELLQLLLQSYHFQVLQLP